jgi:hypothetical protein
MKNKLSSNVNRCLDDLKPENRELATTLIHYIMESNPEFDCEVKWNQITFTLNQNWHHWIVAVSESKKGINLSFHKGALLKDPRKIFKVSGSHLRTIKYHYKEQIDPDYLKRLIKSAIAKQTEL